MYSHMPKSPQWVHLEPPPALLDAVEINGHNPEASTELLGLMTLPLYFWTGANKRRWFFERFTIRPEAEEAFAWIGGVFTKAEWTEFQRALASANRTAGRKLFSCRLSKQSREELRSTGKMLVRDTCVKRTR